MIIRCIMYKSKHYYFNHSNLVHSYFVIRFDGAGIHVIGHEPKRADISFRVTR